ncbi:hypothetical protein CANCADRAFT_45687 [Tortispora caseinolytica NRRL Y-17796]|uniref:SANT domain-containing protein n=1 Tax=Tortispora caseinolytica NRRL Y-17796 TaxID=767744 RepID=A0A1E4TBU8_9ASCO|nr:hypothetical protein CANCADRAFT_45687 [Tortispora caseinolytica NRRL Y-17796]
MSESGTRSSLRFAPKASARLKARTKDVPSTVEAIAETDPKPTHTEGIETADSEYDVHVPVAAPEEPPKRRSQPRLRVKSFKINSDKSKVQNKATEAVTVAKTEPDLADPDIPVSVIDARRRAIQAARTEHKSRRHAQVSSVEDAETTDQRQLGKVRWTEPPEAQVIDPEPSSTDQGTTTFAEFITTEDTVAEPSSTGEVDIENLTMAELCKDTKFGRTSETYQQFEEIRRKRRRAARRTRFPEVTEAEEEFEKARKKVMETITDKDESGRRRTRGKPELMLKNGRIVLNNESLQVDRHEQNRETSAVDVAPAQIMQNNPLERRITSALWTRRERSDRWDARETALFYRALSMWGTDFGLISQMFPGRSRRQIKSKFNFEEKKFPDKVNTALIQKVPADITLFERISGIEVMTLDDFERDITAVKNEHDEMVQVAGSFMNPTST